MYKTIIVKGAMVCMYVFLHSTCAISIYIRDWNIQLSNLAPWGVDSRGLQAFKKFEVACGANRYYIGYGPICLAFSGWQQHTVFHVHLKWDFYYIPSTNTLKMYHE